MTLISDSESKNSGTCQNFSPRLSKPKPTWPKKHFDKGFFSGKRNKFISFYAISEENLTCKQNPSLSKRDSRCPVEHSEEKFIRRIKTFSFFWALNENLYGFWQNKIDRVAWTAFHVSRNKLSIFIEKKHKFDSILRLWEKNFRSFFATFGHGCQTRILSVQSPYWNKSGIRFIFNFPEFWRKLWFALKTCSFVRKAFNSPGEQLSGKNQTFLTLGLWGKNERLSLETWLADLPQTHSMPPQKQFEEKDCFFFTKT